MKNCRFVAVTDEDLKIRNGFSQKVYFLANDYIVSNTKKFSTVSPKNQELLSIFPVNSDKTPAYGKLSQKVHFLRNTSPSKRPVFLRYRLQGPVNAKGNDMQDNY